MEVKEYFAEIRDRGEKKKKVEIKEDVTEKTFFEVFDHFTSV